MISMKRKVTRYTTSEHQCQRNSLISNLHRAAMTEWLKPSCV